MSRIDEYIRYHEHSAKIGDIDPSYSMLLYVCDRFELNEEQRYWLAFLYALTYCGASVFYVYNEFPDFENVNIERMDNWWYDVGREATVFQTDRRWCRSRNQFTEAVESYQCWIGDSSQAEHFAEIVIGDTPEERYDDLYGQAKSLYSFGQFTLFLYLEALHIITPLNLCPTDLDLNTAWSCRNGLYYAYGLDKLVDDEQTPIRNEALNITAEKWLELRTTLAKLPQPPTVWQTETILCAYRKWHRNKRWIGYYLDRQATEITKMEDHVCNGVSWNVLWQFREETFPLEHLIEKYESGGEIIKGGSKDWRLKRLLDTKRFIMEEK